MNKWLMIFLWKIISRKTFFNYLGIEDDVAPSTQNRASVQ